MGISPGTGFHGLVYDRRISTSQNCLPQEEGRYEKNAMKTTFEDQLLNL